MTEEQYTTSSLAEALISINNIDDMKKVLADICTPKELSNIEERWTVCQLLSKKLSYRKIHAMCGSSLTTITRVARFFSVEKNGGYKILLKERS